LPTDDAVQESGTLQRAGVATDGTHYCCESCGKEFVVTKHKTGAPERCPWGCER